MLSGALVLVLLPVTLSLLAAWLVPVSYSK